MPSWLIGPEPVFVLAMPAHSQQRSGPGHITERSLMPAGGRLLARSTSGWRLFSADSAAARIWFLKQILAQVSGDWMLLCLGALAGSSVFQSVHLQCWPFCQPQKRSSPCSPWAERSVAGVHPARWRHLETQLFRQLALRSHPRCFSAVDPASR